MRETWDNQREVSSGCFFCSFDSDYCRSLSQDFDRVCGLQLEYFVLMRLRSLIAILDLLQ